MNVQPNEQNIDHLFKGTTYYIDFYQRQYKWNEEPVIRLLDDVFRTFNDGYKKHKDSMLPLPQLIHEYPWYFLNTYVTNLVDGKLYVVDGQQRLTTLTLILIKLKHLAKKLGSQLEGWIENHIAGISGFNTEFWMNHEAHRGAMKGLLDGKLADEIKTDSGLTAENMVNNYGKISSQLDKEFKDMSALHRFESFVFFFMHRLVLVELRVEQTNAPMIFEVINDRGVKLKPYEVLKGKLLGQVSKEELDGLRLNELWESHVSQINELADEEIDQFFTRFLKAKCAKTAHSGVEYEKNYHRAIFEEEKLSLKDNPQGVIKFLQNDFKYYTDLYARTLKYSLDDSSSNEFSHVHFNRLTGMDTQFLLILSSCTLNDGQDREKIKSIAKELDRLFCLLQLQNYYDSNAFARAIYTISYSIRDEDVSIVRDSFDSVLKSLLSDAAGRDMERTLNHHLFKNVGLGPGNKSFIRYFLARIEKFIAETTDMPVTPVSKLVRGNSFHIEHILAHNDVNLALFGGDEDSFESERNRLGGLLLLKGKDNISSNNESYRSKLATYANTLYWNMTLRADSYKSKLDFTKNLIDKYKLNFRPMSEFGPKELDERHKLLYEMVKLIWK